MERLGQLFGADVASTLPSPHRHLLADHAPKLNFTALRVPNYRRYFIGQVVSVSGTWVQQTAVSWLVLRLGGGGTELGIVVALQFVPLLVLGPFGGVIVDRVPRRHLLLLTSTCSAVVAGLLFVLTQAGDTTLPLLYVFSIVSGLVTVFDNPARQTFAGELVGTDRLAGAIGLNGVVMNTARVVGPALAGLLIAVASIPACFAVNTASYLAVLIALVRIRPAELHATPPTPRGPRQLRQGLGYVRAHPEVAAPLAIMTVLGIASFNFPTVLPLLARDTFKGGAGTFGALTAVMSVGAVAGALTAGGVSRPSVPMVAVASVVFGASMGLVAVAPSLIVEYVVIVALGFAAYRLVTLAMTAVQTNAEPDFRGRVMALWAIAFAGTTPIGGPASGAVAQAFGPRVAFAAGAGAAIVCGVAVIVIAHSRAHGRAAQPDAGTPT